MEIATVHAGQSLAYNSSNPVPKGACVDPGVDRSLTPQGVSVR